MIVVDSREARFWKGISTLRKATDVKVQLMDYGDFMIPYKDGVVLVERSSAMDLCNKLKDGRIWNQLKGMHTVTDDVYFILENPYSFKYTMWNVNSLAGLLAAITDQAKFLVANDVKWTLGYLLYLESRYQKDQDKFVIPNIRFGKKADDFQEESRMVLEGIRGIGGATSHNLMMEFGTLEEVMKAMLRSDDKRLMSIVGENGVTHINKLKRTKYYKERE